MGLCWINVGGNRAGDDGGVIMGEVVMVVGEERSHGDDSYMLGLICKLVTRN